MQITFPAGLWTVSHPAPCSPAAFASRSHPSPEHGGSAVGVRGSGLGLVGALVRGAEVRSHAQVEPQPGPLWVGLHWFKGKIIILVVFQAGDSPGRLMFAVYSFHFCGGGWTLSHCSEPPPAPAGVFSCEKIKAVFKRIQMVSGDVPTEADNVFGNTSYFKMCVWSKTNAGCRRGRRRTGRGTGSLGPPEAAGLPLPTHPSEKRLS